MSLGRVQTPTLAMLVKREREIQAFVAEPYWLVHAAFQPPYQGIWFEGDETRIKAVERADEIVSKVSGKDGTITKVERKEQSERAPLLYDLTSLQRDANRRYGFSARRTLQAAQKLYEDKKAITYPRTSSRYLSGDMVPQLKIVASTLQDISDYREAATYVMRLDQLPLADGRFHLRLGLTDETGERLYHWLDDALAFVVYPAGEERGVVRLEGRWSGEEIGAPTETVAT